MKYWVKIKQGQESLGSRVWEADSPFLVGGPSKLLLDRSDKGFLALDISTGESLRFGEKNVQDEEVAVKVGSFELVVTAFPTFQAVDAAEVSRHSSVKIALPESAVIDPDNESFRKISKYTYATGLCSLIALFASTFIIGSFKKEEAPQLVQQKMTSVQIKNAPTPAVVAAAYEQAMKQGAAQAEKIEAKKNPEVAKKTAVANLKSAFASLMGGGITSEPRSGKGDPSQKVGALLPGVQGTGQLGRGDARGGGAKGDSIVQVAVSGSGKGGYQSGGDIGVGGVEGQGNGWLSLNLSEAMVDEGLSRDEVGKVIHAKISEIRYCYESSMLRKPELEGKLVIDFVIGNGGRVRTANVKETSVEDERLNECILKRLARWEFPKPKSGVEVAVSYPFIFKRLRR
jgi:TonB family protein